MDDGLAREVELIVRGEHANPHSVLGRHMTADGAVVRAFRPNAEKIRVMVDGEALGSLERVHPGGVFAGVVAETIEALDGYELEVAYAHGDTFNLKDPYSFLPTLGELDLHLVGEGRHEALHQKLGSHVRTVDRINGTTFAVWAPNARSVRVIGDFNGWDGRLHPMRSLGASGVWELFVPGAGKGDKYKYEILTQQGWLLKKADPYAQATECPPATAGVVFESEHVWGDDEWMATRKNRNALNQPLSIYEVHLASWRRGEGDTMLSYRDLAGQLVEYCSEMGFTHVEFLPVSEHPFGPSWGYQVSYYFAPTARMGDPDGFRELVDALHQAGIGVIVDWVPAHFPKDDFALARYDGSALYEHADPRQGEHPDWGTLVFNFGRNEVRNFLLTNALFWLEEYHIDGLRVDAVASMLYLDYSREDGQWVPNEFGGRENLDAIRFLQELNTVVHERHPGVLMMAEESTAWPGVSRPTYTGGLGFGFKWNMGWMHDTLDYFQRDPIHRRFHHHQLTFAMIYAWHENFILPLSHDEVVHGKGSLAGKMPGDRWQQLANLRALYGYMWAHPGKQLLFMGSEFAQSAEWKDSHSLDWHLTEFEEHKGVQNLVRDLNLRYREEPALWENDFTEAGFRWIDANNSDHNVLAYIRYSRERGRCVVCVANLAPVVRHDYRVGMPRPGGWKEIINSDAAPYGGSNAGNAGRVIAEEHACHGFRWSASMTLPPLGTVWFVPEDQEPV